MQVYLFRIEILLSVKDLLELVIAKFQNLLHSNDMACAITIHGITLLRFDASSAFYLIF